MRLSSASGLGAISFGAQFRNTTRRDRSSSASRSVHFRLEIGRVPRRDRLTSGSRSVRFRTEIGSGRRPRPLLAAGDRDACPSRNKTWT
ncbi:MAG: hypothetical protein DI576_09825 [Actinomyces sp.]|nr:MAG: hypothetical protein DI576_09825 [Actinomyces sp.]